MNDITDLNIYNITNFLINVKDLISLSLVSKEYNKICKIKLDSLKDDYYIIGNIFNKEKKLEYQLYLKKYFNPSNKYILNSWYKYGYYIFPSRTKLDIPKNEKFKIIIYGKEDYYKVIIKKKKKYRF